MARSGYAAGMWGDLAAAVARVPAQPAPEPMLHTRDLAQVMDAHIVWQESGMASDPLQLPALFAVTRLIASTIDQLPLVMDDGSPAPGWLRHPVGALDQGDLVGYAVTSMILHGAAYFKATLLEGQTWRLDALRPEAVQVVQAPTPEVQLEYRVAGERLPAVRGSDRAPGVRILPVPYMVTPARPWGTSPVVEARETLHGYLAAERQAANLLDSGTWSGGILQTDQDITADSAARWQQAWFEARKVGRVPVLGAGLTYSNEAIDPVKAQYLESRTFAAAQVAQMFGVPPDILGQALMGSASSLSYANSQDNLRRFRLGALEHFTTQLSDGLSQLLKPGRGPAEERRVMFDYTEWERGGDLADVATA